MNALDVMGSRQRLKILRSLTWEDKYISQLMQEIKTDSKTLQYHLSTLEKAEIIKTYRIGRKKYYKLVKDITISISPQEGQRKFLIRISPL